MLGPTGAVLYVGQSRVLRTRLLSYFRANGRRNKAARILRHAFDIEWEYTNTEFGALLRELRLIKLHRPHFNSMMVTDDWPRAYVALSGGAVPGLRVVPRSDDPSAVALFGPFRRVSSLREAVRALAEATGVRDCSLEEARDVTRVQALWFGSDTLGVPPRRRPSRAPAPRDVCATISAPARVPASVTGTVMRIARRAEAVRDFLEGRSDAPVAALTRAMQEASRAMEFERAAVLRDRLQRVSWLHQRVQHFHANMDRLTFRYHADGTDGREWVYLVRRGTVRAEVAAPYDR